MNSFNVEINGEEFIMKHSYFKKNILIYLLGLFALFPEHTFSQTGRWLIFNTRYFGHGDKLYACGSTCAVFTTEYADSLLIFDARKSEVLSVKFPTAQTFRYAKAKGSLVMAYSEGNTKYLVGYSSVTGTLDTLQYAGDVMSDGPYAPFISFGCGERIAFFVSDQMFYVFDAQIGHWLSYDYQRPPNYENGAYSLQSDCVVFSLAEGGGQRIDVAYSAYTKSFNRLEKGAIVREGLKHGFADVYFNPDNKIYTAVGYSAFDNQFDAFSFTLNESDYLGISSTFVKSCWDPYAYSFSIYHPDDTGDRIVSNDYYGYSTKSGQWSETNYEYNYDNERLGSDGSGGGCYTLTKGKYKSGEEWFRQYVFYYAQDGSFEKLQTDLQESYQSGAYEIGGNTALISDGKNLIAFDPLNKRKSEISLAYDRLMEAIVGENYAAICNYSDATTSSNFYIYNENTNQWTTVVTDKPDAIYQQTRPFVFTALFKPYNLLIIYDALEDNLVKYDMEDDKSVYVYLQDDLVVASTEKNCILYDVSSKQLYEKDYKAHQYSLGRQMFISYDESAQSLCAYSGLNKVWSEKAITETPWLIYAGGNLGVASLQVGYYNYAKYLMYNGFADSWVELDPDDRTFEAVKSGDSTMIIVHSDHLYIFDAQVATAIEDNHSASPLRSFILEQNYPNPFNGSTTIRYYITQPVYVKLQVYNVLGQKVATLVDEKQLAGYHEIQWQAGTLPSGLYFYRLQSGDKLLIKKCLLVK